MKHFLPVNIGDTEGVLELIYVSQEQVLHSAVLIGALQCACSWDHYHQGKRTCRFSCASYVCWPLQQGFRYTVIGRFTKSPFQ